MLVWTHKVGPQFYRGIYREEALILIIGSSLFNCQCDHMKWSHDLFLVLR